MANPIPGKQSALAPVFGRELAPQALGLVGLATVLALKRQENQVDHWAASFRQMSMATTVNAGASPSIKPSRTNTWSPTAAAPRTCSTPPPGSCTAWHGVHSAALGCVVNAHDWAIRCFGHCVLLYHQGVMPSWWGNWLAVTSSLLLSTGVLAPDATSCPSKPSRHAPSSRRR